MGVSSVSPQADYLVETHGIGQRAAEILVAHIGENKRILDTAGVLFARL
jgi:hypothetical protein